jgi:outer membrane protein OmpA-like peptidoglycan-associated protein
MVRQADEPTLVVLEVDVSAQAKRVKLGLKLQGSYLHSKNGKVMGFEKAKASAGQAGKGKPKIGKGWDALFGRVSRRTPDAIIDFSKPFPGSKNVVGNLDSATHFCFDSALLTPAARQFLRFICADRLAVLSTPDTKILIVGHTDRPASFAYNQRLSELRAQNVRLALKDILDGVLQIPIKDIPAVGLSEVEAIITDLLKSRVNEENVPRPEYRRVDLFIDFSLVASFRPQLKSP